MAKKKNNIHSKIKELEKSNPDLSYHQRLLKALGAKIDDININKKSEKKNK